MKRGLVAALVTVLAASGLTLVAEGEAHAEYCEPVASFALGGNGDPWAVSFAPDRRKVWYPAEIWPVGAHSYNVSVAIGRDNMISAVQRYAGSCPGQIVVMGYSEGARAAGDAIEYLQNGSLADRISGVLYSDPKHPGGIEDALQGTYVPVMDVSFTGPRTGFTVPVTSYCNANDAVCNFPLWQDPIRAARNFVGYLTGAHRY
ncbi:PE-PPE domain-containing protein [Nocardia sp. NPDC001965]